MNVSRIWILKFQIYTPCRFLLISPVNPFQPSVPIHIETSHLICWANQMTGFYMKCKTALNWVKDRKEIFAQQKEILTILAKIKLPQMSNLWQFKTKWTKDLLIIWKQQNFQLWLFYSKCVPLYLLPAIVSTPNQHLLLVSIIASREFLALWLEKLVQFGKFHEG